MVEYYKPISPGRHRLITLTEEIAPRKGMVFTGQVFNNPRKNKPDFITNEFQNTIGFVTPSSAYLDEMLKNDELYRIEVTTPPERLASIRKREFNFFHAFPLRKLDSQEVAVYHDALPNKSLCAISPEDFRYIRQAILEGHPVSSSEDTIQRDINYLRKLTDSIIALTL